MLYLVDPDQENEKEAKASKTKQDDYIEERDLTLVPLPPMLPRGIHFQVIVEGRHAFAICMCC